jgi:hypothetical protein
MNPKALKRQCETAPVSEDADAVSKEATHHLETGRGRQAQSYQKMMRPAPELMSQPMRAAAQGGEETRTARLNPTTPIPESGSQLRVGGDGGGAATDLHRYIRELKASWHHCLLRRGYP